MRILYITHDGITDHIGQSQVAPYLIGLAAEGHIIHVLSAEKPDRTSLIKDYARQFAAAGIGWTHVTYHNRPPLISTIVDLRRMWNRAREIVEREEIEAVHCRGFLPTMLGTALKRRYGTHLLFDFRDFWADGGQTKGRFAAVYRGFKRREGGYVAAADQIVCLTDRATRLLDSWYPDPDTPREAKYQVIPCCADFALFDPATIDAATKAQRRRELDINADDTVLLYLGSLGRDYLLDEMLTLFAVLRTIRPSAKFLFLSNNGEAEVRAATAALGIPDDAVRFRSAARPDVPSYIAIADLSVIFIRPDLAKAGCSPTKLAELLAMNVPVIANSGFGDIDVILSPARNCSVIVADYGNETLAAALRTVLDASPDHRAAIRAASIDYSLEAGVKLYEIVYDRLAAIGSDGASARVRGGDFRKC